MATTWKDRLMAAVLATGVGYVAAAYLASRWLTRRRRRRPERTPTDLGLPWQPLTCRTVDGLRLAGWLVEPPAPRGTVTLFHGLGCNRDQLLERIGILAGAGYRCVAFDHRAHGHSQGRRTSFGFYEGRDVEAVLDLVKHRWPAEPRVALGISMGAAAVCFGAERTRGVDAVILESMYHDILSAFTTRINAGFPAWYGWLSPGLIWITERRLRVRLEDIVPANHIGRLSPTPVLVLTGTEDSHASPEDAHRLASRLDGPHEVALIEGAGHTDLIEVAGPLYAERVLDFLDRHLPAPAGLSSRSAGGDREVPRRRFG
jgi:alpha-beta hydrolase superfamily lysophospholipase